MEIFNNFFVHIKVRKMCKFTYPCVWGRICRLRDEYELRAAELSRDPCCEPLREPGPSNCIRLKDTSVKRPVVFNIRDANIELSSNVPRSRSNDPLEWYGSFDRF